MQKMLSFFFCKDFHGFTFNSQFLYELKDKLLLSKTVSGIFFFNWDLLHAMLNSHYKACSYKKKKHKKIKAYRKSL